MKKIVLVGLVPPPFNGQSVAFGLLIDRMKAIGMNMEVINMSYPGEMGKGGRGNFQRAMDFGKVFLDLIRASWGGNIVLYLQVAQSRRGFMRDMMINKVAGLFGVKTVVHLHGGNYKGFYSEQPENIKRLVRRELDKYASIIILSDRLKDMFSFHPGVEGKIVSLANGIGEAVDPVRAKVLPCLRDGGSIKLLYLSNMILAKGYMRVLEAVNLLNQKGIPVEATFCGAFLSEDGGNDSDLESKKNEFFGKVSTYQLEGKVKFTGVVTGMEKEKILNDAHFFVLPTDYHNEGQPISIIEAMRYGNVVISTDYRAIPDMIDCGVTGYLLKTLDPAEIAERIAECVSDANKFESMSRNAILKYNQEFTADAHTRKLIQLLEGFANKN